MLVTQAVPEAQVGVHMLGSSVVVHTLVLETHASVVAQNEARQGVVLTVAASSNVQPPVAGVAPVLVATRTLEIRAPPMPPGAMDW